MLLAEGKSNRLVAYKGGQFVDYDIQEALNMKKDIPEEYYEIRQAAGFGNRGFSRSEKSPPWMRNGRTFSGLENKKRERRMEENTVLCGANSYLQKILF